MCSSQTCSLVLSTTEPSAAELGDGRWVPVPEDASAIVVREYIADRATEQVCELHIEPLEPRGAPPLPDDAGLAQQLTALGWTIAKLATLHRTIKPELLDQPNQLLTAEAAELGAADTTPDNLYMLGTFRLDEGEALVIDLTPPQGRYWSVTLENIWHECIDHRRRLRVVEPAEADEAAVAVTSVEPVGVARVGGRDDDADGPVVVADGVGVGEGRAAPAVVTRVERLG